jgi:hypothetical protein
MRLRTDAAKRITLLPSELGLCARPYDPPYCGTALLHANLGMAVLGRAMIEFARAHQPAGRGHEGAPDHVIHPAMEPHGYTPTSARLFSGGR